MALKIATILFGVFLLNVFFGSFGGKQILNDVSEMLLLLVVVVFFVAAILKKETMEKNSDNS